MSSCVTPRSHSISQHGGDPAIADIDVVINKIATNEYNRNCNTMLPRDREEFNRVISVYGIPQLPENDWRDPRISSAIRSKYANMCRDDTARKRAFVDTCTATLMDDIHNIQHKQRQYGVAVTPAAQLVQRTINCKTY